MATEVIALPCKRKRRPPNSIERIAIFQVVWCFIFTCFDIWRYAVDPGPFLKIFSLGFAFYMAYMLKQNWSIVWNYIKHGYEDD